MIRKYSFKPFPTAPQPEPADPPDELTLLLADLKTKDFDQLATYAKERNIDLGQTTSAGGAYKKIEAHLLAEKEAGGKEQ